MSSCENFITPKKCEDPKFGSKRRSGQSRSKRRKTEQERNRRKDKERRNAKASERRKKNITMKKLNIKLCFRPVPYLLLLFYSKTVATRF